MSEPDGNLAGIGCLILLLPLAIILLAAACGAIR